MIYKNEYVILISILNLFEKQNKKKTEIRLCAVPTNHKCNILWGYLYYYLNKELYHLTHVQPYKDSFHYTLKCIKVQSIFNGDFTLHR